ncbi:MAG: extracellular solute-binding protein [Spirochaetaceae bacterium]|nr:extracellular solute-binding protein [Spirochaetaceae bacterium]
MLVDALAKLKGVLILLAVCIGLVVYFTFRGNSEQNYSAEYEGQNLQVRVGGRQNTYSSYLENHAGDPLGAALVPVDLFSYTENSSGVSPLSNYEGEARSLRAEEVSFLQYNINIPAEGMYNIYIEYFPAEARGIAIERSFTINGGSPFLGSEQLSFQRVWGDAPGGIRYDNQGNMIRPTQVEKPRWESSYFKDYMGYYTDPYRFYFKAGRNTIELTGINEPLVIRKMEIRPVDHVPSYKEYIEYSGAVVSTSSTTVVTAVSGAPREPIKIQGEDSTTRSDPSLYAVYDRSSGATEPSSVAKIVLNMIGGNAWRVPGQWIEWEFDVGADDYYALSIKARQNYNRGFVSNRSVMIDGAIPCAELSAVPFRFSNTWELVTLNDGSGASGKGEPLYFPLKKGKHTIRMEVSLGDLGVLLNTMEESVFRLNEIYRKILVLTGPEPDPYRDYRVDFVYPEVIRAMQLESKILYKLVDDLTAYAGERGSQTAVALTLAKQCQLLARRPDRIPRTLSNFKSNISSLGDSLNALSQSQLDIDWLMLSTEDAALPRVHENFLQAAAHEVQSFGASFVVDYNNLGDVYDGSDVVEVWILSGRDQSTILKSMIDDTFTPNTGIKVNVKLVAADAVMPAVVAGTGPDIGLTILQGDPVNYALRSAAVDLSQFPDFDKVIQAFTLSAMVPFYFEDGCYALPETQYFHVMFYRSDILEQLGVDPPQTWEDLIKILPVIQKSNMNVGIPSLATASDFSGFLAQLYQRSGKLYNADGSRTLLDSEVSIEAFDAYTKFYTHYKTPTVFDFVNRFRTGEMPLGFADYTTFNTLEVFAPEIRGLWDFGLLPGIRQSDGSIKRTIPTGSTAAMIYTGSKVQDKAWEFLKWWVSDPIQLRFGRELESVMGAAGRYPTSNVAASKGLSWGAKEMQVLTAMREWTQGTPEVPGGYYVNRHIVNATRKVLNEGADTRETLLDYSRTINDELIKKRKEFGLE